jgi:hypothetical protein
MNRPVFGFLQEGLLNKEYRFETSRGIIRCVEAIASAFVNPADPDKNSHGLRLLQEVAESSRSTVSMNQAMPELLLDSALRGGVLFPEEMVRAA